MISDKEVAMRAYPKLVRLAILRESDAGKPTCQVAKEFRCSPAWVRRVKQQRRELGKRGPYRFRRRDRYSAKLRDRIKYVLIEDPGLTVDEVRQVFGVELDTKLLFAIREEPLINNDTYWHASEAKLTSAVNSPGYVADTMRMTRTICADGNFKKAAEIRDDRVEHFVAKMQAKKRGGSARTRQKYLNAICGFTRWLVQTGKLQSDPLAKVNKPSPAKDRRHERRMLHPDEWPHLAAATAASPVRYRMKGTERLLLYGVAIEAGLRANELRELTRSSLVFDPKQPYIVARAGTTKNRKPAKQYIRLDLADQLRVHIASKSPKAPLFTLPDKWDMWLICFVKT